MQSNDEAVTSLVFDARTKAGADQAVADGQRVIKSMQDVVKATSEANDSIVRSSETLSKQSALLSKVARDVDPFNSAMQKASNELSRMNGIAAAGGVNAQRAADLIPGQIQKIKGIEAAAQAAAISMLGFGNSSEVTAARLASLATKFDPATASAKKMTSELADLHAAMRAGVNIIGGYENAFNKIVTSYNTAPPVIKQVLSDQQKLIEAERALQIAQTTQIGLNKGLGIVPNSGAGTAQISAQVFKEQAIAEAALEAEQVKLANSAQLLKDKLNPLQAVSREYTSATSELNKFLTAGLITQNEFTNAMNLSKPALINMMSGVRGLSNEHEHLTGTSNKTREAMVLMREYMRGDLSRMFGSTTIELQNFGLLMPILSALANPFVLLGLAVTATAAIIETRFLSNQIAIKQFDAVLKNLDGTSQITGKGLLDLSFNLRASGESATDAKKAILEFSNNLSTNFQNPNAIAFLAKLGLAVGTKLQIGDAAGQAEVNRVLKEGAGAVADLGLKMKLLTVEEAAQITTNGIWKDNVKATDDGLKLLDSRLGDIHKKTLTDIQNATHTLTGSWNEFLNSLADSQPVKIANEGLKTILDTITNIVNGPKEITFKVNIDSSDLNNFYDEYGNKIGGGLPPVVAKPSAMTNFRQLRGQAGFLSTGGALRGGALQALQDANINDKDIQDLNQAFAQRVNDFLNSEAAGIIINSAARFGSHPSQFNIGGTGLHNADILGQGLAVDLGNLNTSSASRLSNFGLHQTVPGDWGHIEPIEIPTASQASGAARMAAARDFINNNNLPFGLIPPNTAPPSFSSQGMGSNLFPKSNLPIDNSNVAVNPEVLKAFNDQLEKENRLNQQALEVSKLIGPEKDALAAKYSTINAALEKKIPLTDAEILGDQASKQVYDLKIIQLGKLSNIEDLNNKLTNDTTKAYMDNSFAAEILGKREEALGQARLKAVQEGRNRVLGQNLIGSDPNIQQQKLLDKAAQDALLSDAKKVASMETVIASEKRLADASYLGLGAEHAAIIAEQARTQTQAALNAALAASADPNIRAARTETELSIAIANTKDQAILAAKALEEKSRADLTIQDLSKQTVVINAQVQARKDQIEVDKLEISLQGQTSEFINSQVLLLQTKQSLLNKGIDLTSQIAQNDLKSVDALGKQNIALTEANLQWKRIEEGVRGIADTIDQTLVKSITDAFDGKKVTDWATTIKTALGSIISQIANFAFLKPLTGTILGGLGFGNLAQSFGNFGSVFGGGGGSSTTGGTLTQTGTNAQGQPIFSFSNVGSAVSVGNNLGLFGDTFSGIKSFFNNIGGNLGFATSSNALSESELLGLGLSPEQAAGGFGTGSLFGTTTLGGFLGGAGAGFGAGSLLNSLVGGNQLGGTIGSGLGSLAGAAIGSIIPGIGTLIGGLIGGSGGGLLGGLFGNSKPSNFVSAGSIDLGTGTVAPFFSSGNAQNDQTAQQITGSISQFFNTLKQILPGASVPGTVDVQAGSRDGIKISGNIGSLTGSVKFNTAQEAIDATELVLARSLNGVSDTVKRIIGSITDPTQIAAGVQFAAVYDNLKKASDSAFASISSDTQQIGPFAQALDQINTLFQGFINQANQFGLALEPVNAGLAEATKRLKDDFNKGIQDAITAITDPVKLLVIQEQAAGKARLDDATAIGADIVQVNKLNALTLDQIWKSQTQSLIQLQTDLKSGGLSGVTGAVAVSAANDNFKKELNLIQSGNLGELANLATTGSNVVALSQATYGNAPQTARIRLAVSQAVDSVLSNRSFASGTDGTPSGWIRVGENGPEWMNQSGGNIVLPSGSSPNVLNNGEVITLLKEAISHLSGGNQINRQVGVEVIGKLDRVAVGVEKKPIFETPRTKVA